LGRVFPPPRVYSWFLLNMMTSTLLLAIYLLNNV
jgi:hypothetical protein